MRNFKEGLNVCFTLNNYTENQIKRLKSLAAPDCPPQWTGYTTFIIFQEEIAPETGTPHLQGYIELGQKRTMNVVKSLLGCPSVHLEKRLGTQEQAISYCSKSDSRKPLTSPMRYGTPRKDERKAEGRDEFAKKAIDLENTIDSLIDQHPMDMIKYGTGVEKVRDTKIPHRIHIPNIHIFVGPSGSGKSQKAFKDFPEAYVAPWPTGGRWWWPNYHYQEVVVFDEFRHQISYTQMLNLLDSTPMTVEFKGGSKKMTSSTLIFTTNCPLLDWYKNCPQRTALFRRIMQFATVWEFSFENPNQKWIMCQTPTGEVYAMPNSTIRLRHLTEFELNVISEEDHRKELARIEKEDQLNRRFSWNQEGRDFPTPQVLHIEPRSDDMDLDDDHALFNKEY